MGTSVSDMVIMLHILFYTDLGREAYFMKVSYLLVGIATLTMEGQIKSSALIIMRYMKGAK